MSFEAARGKNKTDGIVKALAFIGAVTSAGGMGLEAGKMKIEQINERVLTPAAMQTLKSKGATDNEILEVDTRLHDLMLQELKRLRGEE